MITLGKKPLNLYLNFRLKNLIMFHMIVNTNMKESDCKIMRLSLLTDFYPAYYNSHMVFKFRFSDSVIVAVRSKTEFVQ